MSERYSIAVVGAGPKGTYALDCLARALEAEHTHRGLDVHIFEPHPHPGAGPVYDLGQPRFLRLNYANDQVDMWSSPAWGPSLLCWLQRHHPDLADPRDSAPRAVVGEYLHAGFRRIIARLSRHATVRLHPTTVDEMRRSGGRWILHPRGVEPVTADSVLVATGHDSRAAAATGLEGPGYVDSVYPIEAGLDGVAPGAVVAIRGLGLTAIDAVLALTEGRGGRFDFEAGPIPRYRPSGDEPGLIIPYSRTGLLMTPKPWQPPTVPIDTASTLVERCASAIENDPEPVDGLAAFLHEVATDLLREAGSDLTDHTPPDAASAVLAAHGRGPLSRDAAVGAAWRQAYPAVVAAVAERRFDGHWESFAELARRMERLAFGPPAPNAARFVSLVEAGLVDLSVACDPLVERIDAGFCLSSGDVERRAHTLVNAVIAPPGVGDRPSALFAGLLRDGHVRRLDASGGVDVTADAAAIGADGFRTPGLAVIGRMTDGATLGNDTLSRSLHDFPERWVAGCVADLKTSGDKYRAREEHDVHV